MNGSPIYDVSIVIPTYRREALVAKTVESCVNQTNTLNLTFQIVVVDNSADRSARLVIEGLAERHETPIVYVSEPRQNISLARNAGIAASDARMVALIDDDEEAPPDWLDHLVGALRTCHADAVFGPVRPNFETGRPPAWDPTARDYVRDREVPTGTPIPVGPSCNVLVLAATCFSADRNFDPEFGLTGGEDTDFFMRLHRMGRKFVWCAEAGITEFIPESRTSVSYILRRRLRSGQTYTWCCVRNTNRPVLTAAKLMFVGFGQIIIWFFPSMILAPFHTPFAVWAKGRMILGLGKIFWGRYFRFDFYS